MGKNPFPFETSVECTILPWSFASLQWPLAMNGAGSDPVGFQLSENNFWAFFLFFNWGKLTVSRVSPIPTEFAKSIRSLLIDPKIYEQLRGWSNYHSDYVAQTYCHATKSVISLHCSSIGICSLK